MQKQDRHQTIIDLIGASRIARQDELVRALGDRGFSVTQASVSRDLDELGIVKLNGAYARPERRANGLGITLISVETAGPNMIVARTPAGLASASTVRIDSAKLPGIVGTIAGDDTIFIAVTGETEQKKINKQLWELFEG
jgi:transcriptional regulator of arginine metabolism